MAYETVKDLLEHARSFHALLSEWYRARGREAEGGRVRMLLEYLAQREGQLADHLEAFEATASKTSLNTWFTFTGAEALDQRLKEARIAEDASLDDVVQAVLQLDETIAELYRFLAAESPSEELREVFQSLLREEEKEESLLVRMASDLERFM